MQTGIYFPKPC